MRKAIILLALICTGALQIAAQNYQDLCDKAFRCIEADSLDRAQDYIRQALRLEPSNPHNALLFSNLGTIQRRQGKTDLALESYTFALNFTPRSVPILMNRATLYLETGREYRARVDYSLVLDLDKDNTEALLMRAYIYMKARDYKSARADYQHLLQTEPTSFSGRLGLAIVEHKAGRLSVAQRILSQMIEAEQTGRQTTDKELATLYTTRAEVEKDLKQPDAALIDLEEAIKLDEKQAEAYLVRGQIYLQQNRKKQARRDFEQAIALGIPRNDLHHLLQECK